MEHSQPRHEPSSALHTPSHPPGGVQQETTMKPRLTMIIAPTPPLESSKKIFYTPLGATFLIIKSAPEKGGSRNIRSGGFPKRLADGYSSRLDCRFMEQRR